MRNRLVFISLSTLLLIFLSGVTWATHIVGGDFYYKQVGTNRYEITMKLYFDCFNGMPEAIKSDEEAIISIFDGATNRLDNTFEMTRVGPVRLNKVQYKCVIPEQNVCVDQYTYVRTITLNPGANGKVLSFQRCCRNNTINNIVNPESTGSTYWVKIPGTSTVNNDNSPVFKELPPNYICTNAPLVFDHSATDSDNDSLVYELYQPFLGANRDKPRPAGNAQDGFFDEPPFTSVIWKFPYSTENQMAGAPILEIDSKTGLLTVTPTVEGQFVIGIKVKEFRNGVLIGETLRDYQFNVRPCKFDVVSAFAAPIYSCSDTVYFTNKSYKATNYRWDFGDTKTSADTSIQTSPYYVYPGNGNYKVTLKASNSLCEDVFTTTVMVRSKILLNLGPDDTTCFSVNKYLITNVFDATRTVWNTGQRSTFIQATQPGTYIASVFYGTCTASDTIILVLDPVTFDLPEDRLYCDSVTGRIEVDPLGRTDFTYKWNNNPTLNKSYLDVNSPGTHFVEVRNRYCRLSDTVELWIAGKPKIGPYLFVCNEFEKELDAGDFREATYRWSNGNTSRLNTINSAGKHWVEVIQRLCRHSDTLTVENPVIPLELGPNLHFCDSFLLQLSAPSGMNTYAWSNESNTRDNSIRLPGKYWVTVTDTNGCERSDTIEINVTTSPSIFIGNDTTICVRSRVDAGVEDLFSRYEWSHGESGARSLLEVAGKYVLTVTDRYGCRGTDSIQITVDPNALPNDLFIPNAFTPNDDGLNDRFPFSYDIQQPEYHLMVFNRWGEKLFDSREGNGQSWNGLYQSGVLRPEAYIYLVEYRGCDGDYRRSSGTVTLLK